MIAWRALAIALITIELAGMAVVYALEAVQVPIAATFQRAVAP